MKPRAQSPPTPPKPNPSATQKEAETGHKLDKAATEKPRQAQPADSGSNPAQANTKRNKRTDANTKRTHGNGHGPANGKPKKDKDAKDKQRNRKIRQDTSSKPEIVTFMENLK